MSKLLKYTIQENGDGFITIDQFKDLFSDENYAKICYYRVDQVDNTNKISVSFYDKDGNKVECNETK